MEALKQIEEDLQEIAGEWDGDQPGIEEERSYVALEAKELDYERTN